MQTLFQLLSRCANPSGSRDGIRLHAGPEIRIELYKALREVLDIARQVDHNPEDIHKLDTRDDMWITNYNLEKTFQRIKINLKNNWSQIN